MEEKSAYEQLEYLHEQTNLEHYCYQPGAFGHITIHQFNNMPQNKTFLQIQEYEINTQIATVNLPTPIALYPDYIQNEDINQIFAKHLNVNIFAFKHCSLTVSVSYLKFLDVFAITHQQKTRFYKMNQHFQENIQLDRIDEVAKCFFLILNQLSQNAIDCLKLDIENRSIIGMYCYKWILWVGIVDHYGKQYLHHPEETKKFLSHYGLQLVQVVCHQNVNYENFQKIYQQTRNDYLFDYNDMDLGTTLYLWDDKNFISCYYIPHKHYEILEAFKSQVRDKRYNISQQSVNFLSQYDLSLYEMEFYKKYIQRFCDFPNETKVTFSTLTSQIFNSILLNQNRCTRKLDHRYSLAQCIKPEAIIIVPIGFHNYPFFDLYDQLQYFPFLTFMARKNLRVDFKYQIYCYEDVVDYNTFLSLCQELKKNQNTKVIGLFQSSLQNFQLQNGKILPFDAEFIIFNLIQSSESLDKFDQTINKLNQFLNVNYDDILKNQICECNLIPDQQEIKKIIQNHNLVDEFLQLFNKKQTIQNVFEKFKKASQDLQLDQKFYKEESNSIIQKISQISQIFFLTSKNSNANLILYKQYAINKVDNLKAPKQQNKVEYQIQKEDWPNIEDYVADVMDIIVLRSQQGKSQINQEIQFMKDNYHQQIFNNGRKYFERCLKFIYLETTEPQITLDIQLCVLVMNGLILLIPERKNIIPFLVVMTQKLDFESASLIYDSIKDNIEKLSKENVEEYSSLLQTITVKDQNWNTYIVRFNLPQVQFYKL